MTIELDMTEQEIRECFESVEDQQRTSDEAFNDLMLFQTKNRVRNSSPIKENKIGEFK